MGFELFFQKWPIIQNSLRKKMNDLRCKKFNGKFQPKLLSIRNRNLVSNQGHTEFDPGKSE
jgi:hypothetical protein